jgi:hypothetical protein
MVCNAFFMIVILMVHALQAKQYQGTSGRKNKQENVFQKQTGNKWGLFRSGSDLQSQTSKNDDRSIVILSVFLNKQRN